VPRGDVLSLPSGSAAQEQHQQLGIQLGLPLRIRCASHEHDHGGVIGTAAHHGAIVSDFSCHFLVRSCVCSPPHIPTPLLLFRVSVAWIPLHHPRTAQHSTEPRLIYSLVNDVAIARCDGMALERR